MKTPIAIISLGIIASYLAEVMPDLFWAGPPLAFLVLRAYILIESSRLKNNFPSEEDFANKWSIWSSIISASYIGSLLWMEEIDLSLFTSLQATNILTIGAELFYSKLSLIEPDRVLIENQKDVIATLRTEIESKDSIIASHSGGDRN